MPFTPIRYKKAVHRSIINGLFAAIALCVASQATVVSDHGRLKIQNRRLVDSQGKPVRLAGMSLFWSVWGGEKFFNAQAIKTTVDWGATLVRVPAGVATPNANPRYLYKDGYKAFVKNAVRAAVDNGIYVIIDWHVEGDSVYEDKAKAFFAEMARAFGDKPNVIYEIWNEPIKASWPTIKAYATNVIAEIRKYSPNLVIVGSPTWSNEVDKAAADPLADANVAYSFHFYACSHPGSLRERVRAAADSIPIFFTEWGTSESSGGGSMCPDSAQKWLDLADELGISWANWSLFNKNETSAALMPSAGPWGGWTDDQLSASGKWVKSKIREAAGSGAVSPKVY